MLVVAKAIILSSNVARVSGFYSKVEIRKAALTSHMTYLGTPFYMSIGIYQIEKEKNSNLLFVIYILFLD